MEKVGDLISKTVIPLISASSHADKHLILPPKISIHAIAGVKGMEPNKLCAEVTPKRATSPTTCDILERLLIVTAIQFIQYKLEWKISYCCLDE